MKKLLKTMMILTVLVGFAFAGWQFDSVLWTEPGTVITNDYGAHGVAVDPDGNIWFGMYNYPTDSLVTSTDTLHFYGPRVFSPDGTELDMSPISILTINGVPDTMYSSCRGMATDHEGNILLSVAGKMYRIDYKTGEGMNVYDFPGYDGSLTKPAVDDNGYIYISTVGPGNPVKILNPDFTEAGNALSDNSGCYNRAIAVSPDGKDLYLGSTWLGLGIRHYHSDIPAVLPYSPVDTLGNCYIDGVFDTTWVYTSDTTIVGTDTTITIDTTYTTEPYYSVLWPEDISIGPEGKVIYAANTQSEWSDIYRGSRWIAFDLATGEELYEIGTPETDPEAPYADGAIWNGRGAAWSPDGNTMYLVDFGYCNITKWTKTETGIGGENVIVSTFNLKQNYPNPFNPNTVIPYSLAEPGNVTLEVYNILGEQVATLVNNEYRTPGNYQVHFNASNIATGVYISKLTFKGKSITQKMLYIK